MRFAYRLTADPDDTMDLVQETLLAGWEKFDQLKNRDRAGGWLKKICLNLFLVKKRAPGVPVFSIDESDSSHEIPDTRRPDQLSELVADEKVLFIRNGCFLAMSRKLTLEQRVVFSLTDMFGMRLEEAAGVLGISLPAAKSMQHRARINLQNFFRERCDIITPDAPCSCRAWAEFAGKREAIRAEAAKRKFSFVFPGDPEELPLAAEKRDKILSIYREIPDFLPDDGWYGKVLESIG